ncbi:MAG: glucose-6-phosphate isomerase [Erysipelotrichaceae bacterium]|jgi:glucose-6-phosphate isomerase|nr:glucose-6-phosphate isomerase [Bacillota bacterium]NLP22731.1 glucose-6-phosphate isomerase [Erysipelotrichaceae bacterium]HCY06562.1 glucose-6-phosphate isomerase [Erysipelotrichaceae bacterium]
MIKFNESHANLKENINDYQSEVSKVHKMIHEKTGAGNDYLGWVDWADNYDKEEFDRILKVAEKVKDKAEVLLVCGIGGSYLGARAAIEMIQGLYPKNDTEVIFIGNTFSSTYMVQVLDYIKDKSAVLNVISKSGTTTETALAFRILKQAFEAKYGKEECKERIIVTTDREKGTLKPLADKEGYEKFVIPDDIGGRYSVITPVGLLPMAIMGIDIKAVMKGLKQAYDDLNTDDLDKNHAYRYAVARRILQNEGYDVEMLITYDSHMTLVAEWWKQLFGESEGKEEKGILPTSANFSTDLHSLGQFIQEGKKVLFETVVTVEKPYLDMEFPYDEVNSDGMNYLSGKSLDWVNKMAFEGTLEAHEVTGGVPNLIINLEDTSAYTFGYMCQFFFMACAMTCYMIDINPFNQPGVEVYKKNMFRLLGKN